MSDEKFPTPNQTKKLTNTGSLEALLDDIANVVKWVAIAIAIIGTIALLQTPSPKPPLIPIAYFLLNVSIGAFVIIVILKIASEIIRILKHQANLPYTGEISKPFVKTTYTCPTCDQTVDKSPCQSCGQKLAPPSS